MVEVLIAVFLVWLLFGSRTGNSSAQQSTPAGKGNSLPDYTALDELDLFNASNDSSNGALLSQLAASESWAANYQPPAGIPTPLAPARPN